MDDDNAPQTPQQQAAVDALKALVEADLQQQDPDARIDPNDGLDWHSMTVGFFLAQGLTSEEAWQLSNHVRYDLGYWQ